MKYIKIGDDWTIKCSKVEAYRFGEQQYNAVEGTYTKYYLYVYLKRRTEAISVYLGNSARQAKDEYSRFEYAINKL